MTSACRTQVVTRNVRQKGVTVGSRDLFEDMLRAVEQHRARPVVDDTVHGFADVATAVRRLPKGRHFGKECVRFDR